MVSPVLPGLLTGFVFAAIAGRSPATRLHGPGICGQVIMVQVRVLNSA